MSRRVAAMRNTVEPMKLAAATSWAAASATLFTSRSPMSIPASSYFAEADRQFGEARSKGPDYVPCLVSMGGDVPKYSRQYSKDDVALYNDMLDAMEASYLRIRRELYPSELDSDRVRYSCWRRRLTGSVP